MKLHPKATLVSLAGGSVDFVQDGEVLGSLPVQPGQTPARDILALAGPGVDIVLKGDIFVVNPRSWAGKQPYGEGSHDSGANPDYQPTSATRMEREMRLMLGRMQAATSRVEARERALAQIERIPTAPAPEPELEVIEREASVADGATE